MSHFPLASYQQRPGGFEPRPVIVPGFPGRRESRQIGEPVKPGAAGPCAAWRPGLWGSTTHPIQSPRDFLSPNKYRQANTVGQININRPNKRQITPKPARSRPKKSSYYKTNAEIFAIFITDRYQINKNGEADFYFALRSQLTNTVAKG
jgi:hypothetical protein